MLRLNLIGGGQVGKTLACLLTQKAGFSLQQSFSLGVTQALSGPIARGDTAVVASEIAALQQWNPAVSALYRMLGEMTLPLAQQKGLGVEEVEAMAEILTRY
jgi:predicted short-subunit dehydrogenase-like oxidoreductase (DUF2520 family)